MRVVLFDHLYNRVSRYYRKHGFFNTLTRCFILARRSIFPNKYIIFYAELSEMPTKEPELPFNFTVEYKKNELEITNQEMKSLSGNTELSHFRNKMQSRFQKKAVLWVIKSSYEVAGFVWSVRKNPVESYFFPLSNKDIHLFDNEILPEHRGKGINSVLIKYVLGELKKEDSRRVFIETRIWNQAEIRSLSKTHFQQLGIARKIDIWGLNISIWQNHSK